VVRPPDSPFAGDESLGLGDVDARLTDPELLQIAGEIEQLRSLPVPGAARERTWALLREELRREPAPGFFARRLAFAPRFWRAGLAGLAVSLAALAAVIGLQGGPGDGPPAPTAPESQVAVATSATTETGSPPATAPGGSAPASTGVTGSTAPPPTGPGSSATGTTGNGPVATNPPPTTVAPPSTDPSATTRPTAPATTATTRPPATTTTSEVLLTKEERQRTAAGAGAYLADRIVAGDVQGAAAAVSPAAQGQLLQLMAAFTDAVSSRVIASDADSDPVAVVVGITDRVPDGQGGFLLPERRFRIDVAVQAGGHTIVGLYLIPGEF